MSAPEIAERVSSEGRIKFNHPEGGGYSDRIEDHMLRVYLEESIEKGAVNDAAFAAAAIALRRREARS